MKTRIFLILKMLVTTLLKSKDVIQTDAWSGLQHFNTSSSPLWLSGQMRIQKNWTGNAQLMEISQNRVYFLRETWKFGDNCGLPAREQQWLFRFWILGILAPFLMKTS